MFVFSFENLRINSLSTHLWLGDVFEKLEEEDEQGWCKGRKDKKVGMYPANFVCEI